MQKNNSTNFSDLNNSPVSLGELKARLLKLNTNPDLPFKIKEDGEYMTASLNLVDKKWIEHFEKAGVTKQFELLLGFNEKTYQVEYRQESGNVEWNNGKPSIVKTESSSKDGRHVYQQTIITGLANETETQTFDTSLVSKPVFDVIQQAGWQVTNPEIPSFSFNIKSFLPWIIVVLLVCALIFIGQVTLFVTMMR